MENREWISSQIVGFGIPTLQFEGECVIPESDSLIAMGSRFHISTLLELIP